MEERTLTYTKVTKTTGTDGKDDDDEDKVNKRLQMQEHKDNDKGEDNNNTANVSSLHRVFPLRAPLRSFLHGNVAAVGGLGFTFPPCSN